MRDFLQNFDIDEMNNIIRYWFFSGFHDKKSAVYFFQKNNYFSIYFGASNNQYRFPLRFRVLVILTSPITHYIYSCKFSGKDLVNNKDDNIHKSEALKYRIE